MARFKSVLLLVAALMVTGLVAACSDDDAQQQDQSSAAQAQSQQSEQPEQVAQADDPSEPFKIGLMLDFTGGLAEYGNEMRKGFDLAIKHINAAGGVWGQPVEPLVTDSTLDPTIATEEARRLVEVERIHAFVCCTASSITLAVTDITAPAGIPMVSPSATSPQLTLAEDDDFLFRSTLSDAAQGPIMAQVAADRGFDNVGLIYRNDAWGQGYATAFEEAWEGEIVSIAIDPTQTSYIAELQQSVADGAQALMVVTFVPEAEVMIREAIEQGLYGQFVFSNGAQSLQLVETIGAEHLAGMYGAGPASATDSESAEAWLAAFIDEYGVPPAIPYVKETYDATIALALAAQAAGSGDGAAIRDQLRTIASSPGDEVIASPDSVADGLKTLADGGDVDYVGAATAMEWDEHGDLSSGFSSIWRYTEDGNFEEVEIVAYEAP